MACYDDGDFTCTYDSDAGEGKDYSTLDSWEAASDNDLSGTGITTLDCFDSQNHDDQIGMSGASNTDTTHFRRIRSASGCSTPFAGKAGTGANFVYDGTVGKIFYLLETYSRIEQLCMSYVGTVAENASGVYLGSDYTKAIFVVAYDCVNNDGANISYGFYAKENQNLFYGCIAYGGDDNGFHLRGSTDEYVAAVCCTSGANTGYGFEYYTSLKLDAVWSCYGADNNSGDFHEADAYWHSASGWNAAKDASADLGAQAGDDYKNSIDYTGSMDADYIATAHISANGNAGDRCGRNPYNDFTVDLSDFDDFLRNDTAGDPLFKYDIAGNERPNEDVADAVWDVGASEFVAGEAEDILKQTTYYYKMLRAGNVI